MKNLKRVLSLGLASVMLAGMMVVGASAVDTRDFTDQSEIQHTDAVNTMVALNVINGKDTGAFDPEGTVTRAEMAKMITVALNGGKDFTYGTKATPTYSDIKGHWAESYIEYCSSTGIIAGQGDGTFAPGATVTGSAAAKMMLTAMGYDATQAGMVGMDWEINTNILAGAKDLYKDLETINPSEPLSRDSAAQLIYNGVRATMVEYVYNAQTVNGTLTMVPQIKEKTHFVNGTEVKTTILTEKFNMVEAEGILSGISYVEAAGKQPEKFVYTVKLEEVLETYTTTNNGQDTIHRYDTITFKADPMDYTGLMGEKVNALYKRVNGENVLYGLYGKSENVVTFAIGDISLTNTNTIDGTKKSIKADGTTYNLVNTAAATPAYTYTNGSGVFAVPSNASSIGALLGFDAVSTVKLVSNRLDGKYEYAIVTPAKVAKVTYISGSTITMNNGVGAFDLDDIQTYEGIKKDDFVLFTSDAYTVNGIAHADETQKVTGTVEAMRNTTDVRVNGVWYKKANIATAPSINDDVTLVVVGGTYYDADATTAKNIDNILFVAEAADRHSVTVSNRRVEATMVFADGSTDTAYISKVNNTNATKGSTYTTAGQVVEGALYTFEKKGDTYELTTLANTDSSTRAGYGEFKTGTFVKSTTKPTVGGNVIADDAVVFVRSSNGNGKTLVITGAELKDWGENWGTAGQVLSNKVSGNMTAQVVALISNAAVPNSQGSKEYGMVLSNGYYIRENGSNYAQMSIFNGVEDISVKAEKVWNDNAQADNNGDKWTDPAQNVNTWAAAKAGAFVEYETLKNGNITNVKVVVTAAALTGIYTDREKNVTLTFENDAYALNGDTGVVDALVTNKTVVIYVDTENTKGASGEGFDLATETAAEGYYVKNVVYAYSEVNTENRLDVVFVDVANNLKSNSGDKTLANIGTIRNNEITLSSATTAVSAATSADALAVIVANSDGVIKTSGNLAANDTITLVAANGSTTTYVVKMPSNG